MSHLLNRAPAAGFDQPFEMLSACHERVQRSLQLLMRLLEHLRTADDTPRSREMAADAARDVLRYFDIAAPAHHEDEERHVFPLLLASHDPRLTTAAAQLHADHLAMEAAWAVLRPLLQQVASAGASADLPALQAAADRFGALYAGHIELENDVVFPAARSAMDAAAVRAMGAEMAARRQAATGSTTPGNR